MPRLLPLLLLGLAACPPSDPSDTSDPTDTDPTDTDTDAGDTDSSAASAQVSAAVDGMEVEPGALVTLYVDLVVRDAAGAAQIVVGLGDDRACAYDGIPGALHEESVRVELVAPREPGDHDVTWSLVEATDCGAAIATFGGANDLGALHVLRLDDGFVHVAAASTITGAWTTIDDPRLNDRPELVPVVTQYWNAHGVYNPREVQVGYQPSTGRWRIGNADNSAMTSDAAFHVFVPDERTQAFVYTSTDALTFEHGTGVPDLVADDLVVVASHADYGNLTSDEPLGFWHDGTDWWLYNETGLAFSSDLDVHVVASAPGGNTMRHTATAANVSDNWTTLSHVALDGNPDAILAVTPLYGGVAVGTSLGVWYTGTHWAIFTENQQAMPVGAQFSVMYVE